MDKNMAMIVGSPILGVAVAAILGVLMLVVLLLVTRALASARRIERRLDGLQDDLIGAARNVELTLALTKSAKEPHGGLEPVDKPAAEGWQFTDTTEARDVMLRWVDGGQRLLGVLARTLQDYDRLRAEAEASMHEVERLGGEVGRLREDNGRFLQERAEIAQTLSRIVNDALLPRRQV
jgi:HAMP domain-containing protein